MINYMSVCEKNIIFSIIICELIINSVTATRTLLAFCVRINLLASSPTFSHSSDSYSEKERLLELRNMLFLLSAHTNSERVC